MRQVFDPAGVSTEVEKCKYSGPGTEEDPYVVTWIDNDPRNPMLYSAVKKWSITALVAFATLAVAFVSSAYSGGADEVMLEFGCSREVFTLGISLFVMGYAIGYGLQGDILTSPSALCCGHLFLSCSAAKSSTSALTSL